MSVAVTVAISSTELGDDVEAAAKAFAGRKIMRFLDAASGPPFVAALEAFRRAGDGAGSIDPGEVALFTVGSWDPTIPDQPLVDDGTPESRQALSRHVLESANPTGWLRMLTNNALCQASIVAGFRGPNAHSVGGAWSLSQTLAIAAGTVSKGEAAAAIVVAYDTQPGDERLPPDRAVTRAASVVLAPGDGEADGLAVLLDEAAGGGQAVDALDRGIARTRL